MESSRYPARRTEAVIVTRVRFHERQHAKADTLVCLLIGTLLGTPPFFTPKAGMLLDSTTLALSISIVFVAAGAVAGEFFRHNPPSRHATGKKSLAVALVALYAALGYGAAALYELFPASSALDMTPATGFFLRAAFGVALPCAAAFTAVIAFSGNASRESLPDKSGTGRILCFLAGMMAPLAMAGFYPNRCLYVVGSPSAAWGSTIQQLISAVTESPAPPWAAPAAESPTCFGVDGGAPTLVPALFYFAPLIAARSVGGSLLTTSFLLGLASTWSFSWADPSFTRILCGYSNWFLAAAVAVVVLLPAICLRRRRGHSAESESPGGNDARGDAAPGARDLGLDLSTLTEIEARSIALMLEGLTSAEIAALTGRSPSTIRNTQARAYRKLGFSSATKLKEHCAASRCAASQQENSPDKKQAHTVEAKRDDAPSDDALPDVRVVLAACFALLPIGTQSGTATVPIDFWRGAVLATVCGLLLGSISNTERNADPRRTRFAATAVAVIVCAARFFALRDAPVLCVAAQLIYAAGLADGIRSGRPGKAPASDARAALPAATMAMATLLGMAFEECWRATYSGHSVLPYLATPLVTCAGIHIWHSRRIGKRRTTALICGISLVAMVLPAGNAPAYQAGSVMAGIASFCLQRGNANEGLPNLFAAGILVGLVVGEACGSSGIGAFYTGSLVAVATYSTAICLLIVIVALAISGLYAASTIESVQEAAASDASQALSTKTAERLRLLLASRSLNETQCQVAMMTLDGFPRRSIARKLHLSMGSVNSARAAVYKCFSVHTRAELLAAIDAAMGKKRA